MTLTDATRHLLDGATIRRLSWPTWQHVFMGVNGIKLYLLSEVHGYMASDDDKAADDWEARMRCATCEGHGWMGRTFERCRSCKGKGVNPV